MSTTFDSNAQVIRIDSDDDYVQSVGMFNISGVNGCMVRIQTIVDRRRHKVVSYFFNHRNNKWVIITQGYPKDKPFVDAPISWSSHSAWRSYKSCDRYADIRADVSRHVECVPRPGIYQRWQRIC